MLKLKHLDRSLSSEKRQAELPPTTCWGYDKDKQTKEPVLYHPDAVLAYGQAMRQQALEEAARLLDESADRQEKAWNEHLASGKGGPATTLHAIPRGYAADIRALSNT